MSVKEFGNIMTIENQDNRFIIREKGVCLYQYKSTPKK